MTDTGQTDPNESNITTLIGKIKENISEQLE